ncbi:hypothetical protein [Nostoc sp. CENA543]|nr:hypothetical protein [Nostoc sp. CENA543]
MEENFRESRSPTHHMTRHHKKTLSDRPEIFTSRYHRILWLFVRNS